ncbi:phage tail protein [Photobacterium leiognathi subsp. mandapamensis]|uniref:phage tail protein n=1 Tax=Photobacterium leiognathi TaxID=553611 RepID=UPI003AF3491C
MKLPDLKLPFWLGRGELAKLAKALHGYWQKVIAVVQLPLANLDPMTAPIEFVDLIAWQRDIQRLTKEPEHIYRTRVKYAFEFAKAAGEIDGFERIFNRLGIQWMRQHERQDLQQWDVITIEVKDGDLAEQTYLMHQLIKQYGRTARRYRFQVVYPSHMAWRGAHFDHQFAMYTAKADISLPENFYSTVVVQHGTMQHQNQLFIAQLG